MKKHFFQMEHLQLKTAATLERSVKLDFEEVEREVTDILNESLLALQSLEHAFLLAALREELLHFEELFFDRFQRTRGTSNLVRRRLLGQCRQDVGIPNALRQARRGLRSLPKRPCASRVPRTNRAGGASSSALEPVIRLSCARLREDRQRRIVVARLIPP